MVELVIVEKEILLEAARNITEVCRLKKEEYKERKKIQNHNLHIALIAQENKQKITVYFNNGIEITGKVLFVNEKERFLVLKRGLLKKRNPMVHLSKINFIEKIN